MSRKIDVGRTEYYEAVSLNNKYFRDATEHSYERARQMAEGVMFQRGLEQNPLGNVDNGVSVYQGINYDKLPHVINWGLDSCGKKPIPLKAV